MDREKRLAEYEERANSSEELKHSSGEWVYVPVHKFNQYAVDAYCRYNDDLYFLQVWNTEVTKAQEVGLYSRLNDWEPLTYNLVAVVPDSNVSRDIFEKAMGQFSAIIASNLLSVGENLVQVGDWNDS